MYCTRCGVRLADEARFCHACGTPATSAAADVHSLHQSLASARPDGLSAVSAPANLPMQCPACRLPLPAGAASCRCGCDLRTGRTKVNHSVDAPRADQSSLGLTRRAETLLINLAVGLGMFSGVATAVSGLLGLLGMSAYSLVDSAIMVALPVGVWRRSRICAVSLLTLHLVERVWWLDRTGQATFAVGLFPMLYAVVYLMGVFATLSFHSRARTAAEERPGA